MEERFRKVKEEIVNEIIPLETEIEQLKDFTGNRSEAAFLEITSGLIQNHFEMLTVKIGAFKTKINMIKLDINTTKDKIQITRIKLTHKYREALDTLESKILETEHKMKRIKWRTQRVCSHRSTLDGEYAGNESSAVEIGLPLGLLSKLEGG